MPCAEPPKHKTKDAHRARGQSDGPRPSAFAPERDCIRSDGRSPPMYPPRVLFCFFALGSCFREVHEPFQGARGPNHKSCP